MRKLLPLSLISTNLIFGIPEIKADYDYWAIKSNPDTGIKLYTIDSSTGNATLRHTIKDLTNGNQAGKYYGQYNGSYFDNVKNKFILKKYNGNYYSYDLKNDTWTNEGSSSSRWADSYNSTYEIPSITKDAYGNTKLEFSGRKILEKKTNGEIHIGENSAVFKEENGREKFWATDASGKSIPIDVTNGSKLLINGRDVEQSINNVGALSAALTGLPTVQTDTTLTCGLGTGTHGGDFAFSGGCASKVNEKLSINYAASMTMPGQDYAGDFEDQFSARAGFVWKLGKTNKPTQISMKAKEKMEAKILSLEKNNNKMISQNKDLKEQNALIISQNKALLKRLERLEKIALR